MLMVSVTILSSVIIKDEILAHLLDRIIKNISNTQE